MISAEMRILTAARRLFFERGFSDVSTDLLAREAAVSKATIYRHFENMTDILRRLTELETAGISGTEQPKVETRAELEVALTQFGLRLLNFLNASDTIEFGRVIHEEARKNPDMGQAFFLAAYGKTHETLVRIVQEAADNSLLTLTATPQEISEDLMALFTGSGMKRAMLCVCDAPYDGIDRNVERAVHTIMAVYGTKD
ncbi:transcriptional regulator, TetR family [Sulfitobacter marinus]|uniref:Transcriptional regulator, TetR family n=2 Tax=Sulfitobacter marinus TaxID=394264 RepID=A0A1I6UPK7_9RHOB|nr:transcriptional regulator, TetR family [Sulfitobacter marinus]